MVRWFEVVEVCGVGSWVKFVSSFASSFGSWLLLRGFVGFVGVASLASFSSWPVR